MQAISKLREIFKRHNRPMNRTQSLALTFAVIIILYGTFVFVYVQINIDALKATIEAQATLLGFVGLITVYLLSSFDTRLDRLYQQRHDYSLKIPESKANISEKLKEETIRLTSIIQTISESKTKVVKKISLVALLMVVSLIWNIGLLGFQSDFAKAIQDLDSPLYNIAGAAAGVPVEVFFIAIWLFFGIFRESGLDYNALSKD
jgi:predicted PurR-regulated permease PerM